MLLGIDANGRSLRWLDPGRGRKGTRYAVAGVPPLFPDEQFIWNNPSAEDPTSPDGLIPLEEAWARLSYLEPRGTPGRVPLRWRYRGADAESTLNPAEAIANAIRQNTPIGHAGEMLAVAIPNHLDETGQDDLISALQALDADITDHKGRSCQGRQRGQADDGRGKVCQFHRVAVIPQKDG